MRAHINHNSNKESKTASPCKCGQAPSIRVSNFCLYALFTVGGKEKEEDDVSMSGTVARVVLEVYFFSFFLVRLM